MKESPNNSTLQFGFLDLSWNISLKDDHGQNFNTRRFLFEKLDKIKNNDLDSEDSEIENNTPQQPIKVEEKHQRKKQKVDPLAPKKPANAFFRFCQHQRKDMNSQINQIKSEDSSNSDITKILSNQWKQLPQEEKQIYYDLYEKDKIRYEKEMEVYNNSDQKKNKDITSSKDQVKAKSKSSLTNKFLNKNDSNNSPSSIKIRISINNSNVKSESLIDDTMNSINDTQTESGFSNVEEEDDEEDEDGNENENENENEDEEEEEDSDNE
ncbi:HMG-box [Neocallimastix lanati (nom. inval.)]|nr:HMG-box [Neocallimastix sp. JGI-2020a]